MYAVQSQALAFLYKNALSKRIRMSESRKAAPPHPSNLPSQLTHQNRQSFRNDAETQQCYAMRKAAAVARACGRCCIAAGECGRAAGGCRRSEAWT